MTTTPRRREELAPRPDSLLEAALAAPVAGFGPAAADAGIKNGIRTAPTVQASLAAARPGPTRDRATPRMRQIMRLLPATPPAVAEATGLEIKNVRTVLLEAKKRGLVRRGEPACPQHTFQVLTKRPERAGRFLRCLHDKSFDCWPNISGEPYPNVWLGVSVEDQATADERIPLLLETPAAVRFISAEPLLGPVDLRGIGLFKGRCPTHDFPGGFCHGPCPDDVRLDWVIVGGESGPGARPMHLDWARSLVEQCAVAGVACFVKQLGASPVDGRTTQFYVDLRDRKGGDPEEWPEELRVREWPDRAREGT